MKTELLVRIKGKLQKTAYHPLWAWRWIFNFNRTLRHKKDDNLPAPGLSTVNAALKENGICSLPAANLLNEVELELLHQIRRQINEKLQEPRYRELIESRTVVNQAKDYAVDLFSNEFSISDPLIQLAISPNILNVVNNYLGMHCYLRTVGGWLNFPTHGEAKEAQLWHRDPEDRMQLKLFIYLNNVTIKNGPFSYIPGTHATGDVKVPIRRQWRRINDEEMEKAVSKDKWSVCTAPFYTMTFADTAGFHRGLKPTEGHRILLMFQYTSGRPWCGRSNLKINGQSERKLTIAQESALQY